MIDDVALLRTGRLDLEPLRVDHVEEMTPVLSDPRLYVFIGGAPPSGQELRERYGRQVVGRSPDGAQRWLNWIIRRRDGGAVLGYVQATATRGRNGPAAEVAWLVGVDHQGHGYAREAARAMVDWLRGEGVVEIIAHVHPRHTASEAVARAVGLSPTATVVDGEVCWRSGVGIGGTRDT